MSDSSPSSRLPRLAGPSTYDDVPRWRRILSVIPPPNERARRLQSKAWSPRELPPDWAPDYSQPDRILPTFAEVRAAIGRLWTFYRLRRAAP